jgi:hypothetical protein
MMNSHHNGLLARSAAFTALSIAAVAHAETHVIYVDAARPASGNGSAWNQAFKSLEDAFAWIDGRNQMFFYADDVQIRIAQGVYRPSTNRACAFTCETSALSSAMSLSLLGGYGGISSSNPDYRDFVATPTVLSADVLGDDLPSFTNRGDNCAVVFAPISPLLGASHSPRSVVVSGVTLRGAYSTDGLVGSAVAGNTFYQEWYSQYYSFSDCSFEDNYSRYRSGSFQLTQDYGYFGPSTVALTFARCRFVGNKSDSVSGGPYITSNSTALIEDCEFSRNESGYCGGGLFAQSEIMMARCKFLGNSAGEIGGGLASNGFARIHECLFVGNTSGNQGGGLWLSNSGQIAHCTIASNSAAIGGGLFCTNPPAIQTSIVTMNRGSQAGSQLAGGAQRPYFVVGCMPEGEAGCYFPFHLGAWDYSLPFEPMFKNAFGDDGDPNTWADNDYSLSPRSPLIDIAGQGSGGRDIDGRPRYVEGILGHGLRADVGCYESQLSICPSDIDADGGVTVEDLLAFLDAFESGTPFSDLSINGVWSLPDGAVTVEDLLFFLAKFDQGC